MEYKHAKKLHNKDEVVIKETKETAKVVETIIEKNHVIVYAVSRSGGYRGYTHLEIA